MLPGSSTSHSHSAAPGKPYRSTRREAAHGSSTPERFNSIKKRLRRQAEHNAQAFVRSALFSRNLALQQGRTRIKKILPSLSRSWHVPPSWHLPPTDFCFEKRSGRFPISKGFTLLSISHEGKGNATPWVS